MPLSEAEKRFVVGVSLLSLLCLGLFIIRLVLTREWRYLFVPENLLLAWLPLILARLLVEQLRHHRWASPQNLLVTFLWLFFLPNTWYVLTDFVHVYPTGEISQLFDIIMIASLVFCGFILGFASLYMVHKQLIKRLSAQATSWLVVLVLLFSSFGIYLGRVLRWNSWDVIKNPGGLLLNVSDRIIDPFGHPRALNITTLFFTLLSVMYLAIWLVLHPSNRSK